jgi:hypothetical protein
MTNDQTPLQLPDYSIEYTPTEIKINGLDGLKRAVTAYASRYTNIVVTDDTEHSAKDTRAKLNKLSTALDDKRKEIRREYNKPYDEFADTIKQLRAVVDQTIEPIDAGLKELTEQQRKLRKEHVLALIAEMAPNFGVKAEDLPINPKWLNKSTSKKTVTDGIAADMKQLKIDQDRHQQDITTLTKYADTQKVDPTPWLDQLEQGQDLDYLLKAVDNQVRVNAEREQAKQRKLEAEAAEAKTHQEVKGDAVIDTNTGEVVNRSVDLRITTTIAEMKLLKAYMDKRGIKYHKVGA